jgi:hypothetical protein
MFGISDWRGAGSNWRLNRRYKIVNRLTSWTSWIHRLPWWQLHFRICSNSWGQRRQWLRFFRATSCSRSSQVSERERFWSVRLNGWIALKCPGQMSSLHLLGWCPSHTCHLGRTKVDRKLGLRGELLALCQVAWSDPMCQCLAKDHHANRKSTKQRLQSKEGSQTTQ